MVVKNKIVPARPGRFQISRLEEAHLLAGREIIAGRGRSCFALGARAMRPAPPAREAFATAGTALAAIRAAVHLRLRTGDEGGQAIDAAGVGDDGLRLILRLRLGLILRLRAMVALAVLARLLLIALIGLVFALLMVTLVMIALAVAVAREGLLLLRLRDEARLLAEIREILAVVVAVVAVAADRLVAARLLILAELFLGRGDQTEIMLGVLVVVLGCNGVAGRARVARELEILFSDVRGGAADLDVGSVGLVDPGHRVLAAPVVVVIVIVAVAHPLLVLTVSHVLPLIPALNVARIT
ncbi:hypothetical protein ABH991_001605 [Bradyrhizobium ottawaense]|uniref:Uncharacterized protein n=1 Tax=Bradyrhizobium ottawaense TaxID=931866 RepID=A0ABV4FNX2_9BRAD